MKKSLLLALLSTSLLAPQVVAQPASLTYGEDYTYTGEVHEVTTVQVAPNRVDHYLAGLAESWVSGNEVAIEMGLMKDYKIYVSELANSGDFNVMLVSIYESAAQRHRFEDPDTYAEFEGRVEERLSEEESFEITEGYTRIRDIVGQYLMREVELE
ncbi:MAG: hypothetical protein R3362_03325 [Rhodothermales bacterium]|nr:hypothetical protein [Rhodothermales bacterium]